jgi:lactate permease
MAAVVAGMIIQSTPVSFGALGTPILVGVASGLNNEPMVLAQAGSEGFSVDGPLVPPGYLMAIGLKVAILHTVAGTLIPLFVVALTTRFFGANRSVLEGLRVWRFALFAAVAMTLPYLAVAAWLGPEFPSILGGLIGLAIVVPVARSGWLAPRDGTWEFPPSDRWPAEWTGDHDQHEVPLSKRPMGLIRAWMPYLLVALLLVLTRCWPALQSVLKSEAVTLNWPQVLGTSIASEVQPLYLPGTIFILVSLMTFVIHGMTVRGFRRAVTMSGRTLVQASVALVFTVPMVQVFIHSGGGTAGYEKMPIVLAEEVARLTGNAWPLCAPWIGGFGAFVAGSNTVSNMMFSLFQFGVGQQIGVSPSWIVALQAVGGAAGNTICVHNVVTASAVVGLMGREGAIIRKTLLVFVYYALVTGILGYAIVWSV